MDATVEAVEANALHMLEVRGAVVGAQRPGLTEAVTAVFAYEGPKGASLLCFVPKSLNIVAVKAIAEEVAEAGAKHTVIVHPGASTSQGTRTLQTMELAGLFSSEAFKSQFFWNDLLAHDLVPKHTRAARPEVVRKRYGNGLPVLKTSDSVARYHAFRPGEIVRVERRDGSIAFRRVEAG